MKAGQKAPRTVTQGLRQRAWWVMRNRREASIPQLLATLTDGVERDAVSNLQKYLRALERAGIVKRAEKRVAGASLTSNGHIRYLLVIDCGRAAPVWRQKAKQVYAPDTDTVYPFDTEETSNG